VGAPGAAPRLNAEPRKKCSGVVDFKIDATFPPAPWGVVLFLRLFRGER
jgi:hypothetical protein